MFLARCFNLVPFGKEQDGIEIALHGGTVVQQLPALVEGNPPVESDDIGFGLIHGGQQGGAVGSEVDDRHAGLLEGGDQFLGARQNVLAVVLHAEAANPAIEDLDDVGASLDLVGDVGDEHDVELAQHLVPHLRAGGTSSS